MEEKFLKVAKKAALEAGEVLIKYFGEKLDKNIKNNDDSNFATKADSEAEEIILKIIKENFPGHSIISEESGEENRNSEYTWIIDPLDGTIIYSSGLPYFTTSIGLRKNSKPVLAVIYHPLTHELYHSVAGKGAYLNDQKISVSQTADLKDAILGADFAHRGKRVRKFENYIAPLMNKINYPLALGADILLFAYVARGTLDGFATETNIWDCITGALMIEEAGGKVTDGEGNKIDWSKKRMEIVTSNRLLHEAIIKEIQSKNA